MNLAYNSFDMSEKEYEKIVTETGDGGAKMAPLIENEDSIPNHPFLELMVRGIMNNSTITTLDVTVSYTTTEGASCRSIMESTCHILFCLFVHIHHFFF